jgi:heptosyltransferase-2
MKVLIWQTAYLGDVILITPLIRTLRKCLIEAKVSFVGRPFITELLKGYDINLYPFSKGLWESFEMAEKISDYHVVISPHVSARSALILFFSGIPLRIGFDRSELSWLYTHRVKHQWNKHEIERNLELLKPLGIKENEWIRETKLFVYDEEIKSARQKFNLPEEYIVLSPFSNFPLKEWYLQGWMEIASGLNISKVLIGTEKDAKKAEEIERKAEVINLVGKTSLRELMAVIAGAKLVISVDSSPMHIANALGIPAICIYTSTSPSFGFYPRIGTYLVPSLECSPCSPNPKKCKSGHYACLRAVKPEEVLKQALKFF